MTTLSSPTASAPASSAHLPEWGQRFLRPARYKVAYGGRGSGKTWLVAALLLLFGYERRIRVVCVREVQKTLQESAKRTLEVWVEKLGLQHHYNIQREYIIGRNGTSFFFRGMSTTTEEQARGWEDVDYAWFEEAQRMSQRSFEILRPTIRKDGSEIWFTFNPRYRSDPVYRMFVVREPDNAVVQKVNYDMNHWFPSVLEEERLDCLKYEPERYAHIWLGETDDEGEARLVLPFSLIEQCVDAHKRLGIRREDIDGRLDAGLDVADTGADRNALVMRRGPLVEHIEMWSAQTLGQTTRRADMQCRARGVRRLFYDAGGIGGGIRSHLHDMGERPYFADPVLFGDAVTGPDYEYSYEVSNRQFFARRSSQLAWALRLRAQRTQQLILEESGVRPLDCLFIDGNLSGMNEYLTQLAQPIWDENPTGKLIIDKAPEEAKSPDLYDATALAFGWDSRDGLTAR